jgi:hypothetical protein
LWGCGGGGGGGGGWGGVGGGGWGGVGGGGGVVMVVVIVHGGGGGGGVVVVSGEQSAGSGQVQEGDWLGGGTGERREWEGHGQMMTSTILQRESERCRPSNRPTQWH